MAIIFPKRAPLYAGELANPIPVPWPTDGTPSKIAPSLVTRKLELLAAHYGIDLKQPDAWQNLASLKYGPRRGLNAFVAEEIAKVQVEYKAKCEGRKLSDLEKKKKNCPSKKDNRK